jgi:hypothetical protein
MVVTWLPGSLPGIFGSEYGKSPQIRRFLISIYSSGNENNEIFQENLESKICRSDDSLQVFRGSLPDFVAGAAVWPATLWR